MPLLTPFKLYQWLYSMCRTVFILITSVYKWTWSACVCFSIAFRYLSYKPVLLWLLWWYKRSGDLKENMKQVLQKSLPVNKDNEWCKSPWWYFVILLELEQESELPWPCRSKITTWINDRARVWRPWLNFAFLAILNNSVDQWLCLDQGCKLYENKRIDSGHDSRNIQVWESISLIELCTKCLGVYYICFSQAATNLHPCWLCPSIFMLISIFN